MIEKLFQTRQLEIGERDGARAALATYRSSAADFADCLIARLNKAAGCDTTVTFDRDAARIHGFTVI